MAVDTPATIAVLGAGPIGLEAALYGRYLGYHVDIYERGRVGENLLDFGQVALFSPFGMNRSPLALAALAAQDENWRPPADDAILTARQFVDVYLRPLSQSDLLIDGLHERTRVVAVGRKHFLKTDVAGKDRGDDPFLLLLEDEQGTELLAAADMVIDATGTYGNPNCLGQGGIPAPGERAFAGRIDHGLPDILGRERRSFAGKHVLVVGAGFSAAANVVALAQLAGEEKGTRVTWATRDELADDAPGPIPRISGDRLIERDRLARLANAAARGADAGGKTAPVEHLPGTMVERIDEQNGRLAVRVVGAAARTIEVDRILANVGFRPDRSIYRELHVHECYATEGPIKLAASLLNQPSADCLDQRLAGTDVLLNPEPNFYVLGAKSYGRNSKFLISMGLEQVRAMYQIIGDRADLDLYATARY
ncbi:MAG: FAD-dependent oxidoreductase [Planctomycetia bacterium]|nr:FAD-dependent oxidoreductase [Planctomycetia bacterium]